MKHIKKFKINESRSIIDCTKHDPDYEPKFGHPDDIEQEDFEILFSDSDGTDEYHLITIGNELYMTKDWTITTPEIEIAEIEDDLYSDYNEVRLQSVERIQKKINKLTNLNHLRSMMMKD